jgi:vacuolar-type H+-ATPase subunit I/STV1
MNRSDEIIQRLDSGSATDKELARQYPWASLSDQDRYSLLKQCRVRAHNGEGSIDLLRYVYLVTKDHDDANAFKVLYWIYQRPETDQKTKHGVNKAMEGLLERLRVGIKDRKGAAEYKKCEGAYKQLRAETYERTGDLQKAVALYQEALSDYQDIGYTQGIRDVQKILDDLESIEVLVPNDQVDKTIRKRQKELAQLTAEVRELDARRAAAVQEIEKQQEQIEAVQHQHKETLALLNQHRDQIPALEQQVVASQHQVKVLQEEIARLQVSADFLLVLQQTATAPLWVEVLRLALAQGEIDDLALQAMERLAVDVSPEVSSVLVEAAARLPDPFALPPDVVEAGEKRWLALIAESKRIRDQDLVRATELMVDAWETLFSISEEEVVDVL